jgi:hypothetical protein
LIGWLVGWKECSPIDENDGGWLIGWLVELKRSVPTFRLLRMIGECKVRKEGKKRREDEEEERISRV